MRPSDIPLSQLIEQSLLSFSDDVRTLPGIEAHPMRECLVRQMIDSIRRIKYIVVIEQKQMGQIYADATSIYFDPLKAAVWHKQNGNLDEAFWLVFLSTHFGKSTKKGWGLIRAVYGALDSHPFWTWEAVCLHPNEFRQWLQQHLVELKLRGSFGNHHKYQSLDAYTAVGTGSAIISYIDWIGAEHNHEAMIDRAVLEVGDQSRDVFNYLYNSSKPPVNYLL